MKILKVIHGYPMRYNAGSEVYSQNLCHALANSHEVQVFTREENPFAPDYTLRVESDSYHSVIRLNIINLPLEKHRYRYQTEQVDLAFERVFNEFSPDIVHIGHLNHLSTTILSKISKYCPIIYTLHDYWLMCPRGQFIQRSPENLNDVWAVCNKQKNSECAARCYGGYFSGNTSDHSRELQYWRQWVDHRMQAMQEIVARVDCFIAPSHYLLQRYQSDFNVPQNKIIYLDYGFNLNRLKGRRRRQDKDKDKDKDKEKKEPFTFGYIGTHIPAKGIQLLIKAFGQLSGSSLLRIWGRERGQNTQALKEIAKSIPPHLANQVEWMGEYENSQIVPAVFDQVDAIVVPSIWVENSPLVIHEALQVRVPVITADVGGMAEYIKHKQNGLLFKHRDSESLSEQLQYALDHSEEVCKLGLKGYLNSDTGDIPDIENHVKEIEAIYHRLIAEKKQKKCSKKQKRQKRQNDD